MKTEEPKKVSRERRNFLWKEIDPRRHYHQEPHSEKPVVHDRLVSQLLPTMLLLVLALAGIMKRELLVPIRGKAVAPHVKLVARGKPKARVLLM